MTAPSMNLGRIAFLLSSFVAGCSAIAPVATIAPLPEAVASRPSTAPPPWVVATRPPPAPQPTAGASAPTTPESSSAVIAAPAVPAAAATKKQPAIRAAESPAAATRLPAAPVPAATAAKPAPQSTVVVAAPAARPSLDLNALKEQLKDTKAIGVFTKLSLKNQVEDLLQQFRDFYEGNATITMAQLRRSYDLLLMKVLSLIQDTDQKLASAIVASRESIWGLLSDQKKFSTLEG